MRKNLRKLSPHNAFAVIAGFLPVLSTTAAPLVYIPLVGTSIHFSVFSSQFECGSEVAGSSNSASCGGGTATGSVGSGWALHAFSEASPPNSNSGVSAGTNVQLTEGFIFSSPGVSGPGTLLVTFAADGSTQKTADTTFGGGGEGAFAVFDLSPTIGGSSQQITSSASNTYEVPFSWNTPIELTVVLQTFAGAVSDGFAQTDFSHTLRIQDFKFLNNQNGVVSNVDVQSGSGVNPFVHTSPVPLPGALFLFSSALAGFSATQRKFAASPGIDVSSSADRCLTPFKVMPWISSTAISSPIPSLLNRRLRDYRRINLRGRNMNTCFENNFEYQRFIFNVEHRAVSVLIRAYIA